MNWLRVAVEAPDYGWYGIEITKANEQEAKDVYMKFISQWPHMVQRNDVKEFFKKSWVGCWFINNSETSVPDAEMSYLEDISGPKIPITQMDAGDIVIYDTMSTMQKVTLLDFFKDISVDEMVKYFGNQGKYGSRKKAYSDPPDDPVGAFYMLDTDSGMDTEEPQENEYVEAWGPNTGYMLLKTNREKPFILSGTGGVSDYGIVKGGTIQVVDDGNGTTPYRHPAEAQVLAIANSVEEITANFPKGYYPVRTMK